MGRTRYGLWIRDARTVLPHCLVPLFSGLRNDAKESGLNRAGLCAQLWPPELNHHLSFQLDSL